MILPKIPEAIVDIVVPGVIAILIAAVLFCTGYRQGAQIEKGKTAQAQRDIAIAYAGEIVARQGLADVLQQENAQLRAQQAPRERLITKEITRYVQAPAHCRLPGTFRLLHDAAATGLPPAGPGPGPLADAAPAHVEDTTVLDTVADNYAACREAIAQLEGWQRRQRTLTRAP